MTDESASDSLAWVEIPTLDLRTLPLRKDAPRRVLMEAMLWSDSAMNWIKQRFVIDEILELDGKTIKVRGYHARPDGSRDERSSNIWTISIDLSRIQSIRYIW